MNKFFIGVLASTIILTPFISNQVHAVKETEVKIQLENYIKNQSQLSFSIAGNYQVSSANILLKSGLNYKIAVENGILVLYDGTKKVQSLGSSATLTPESYNDDNWINISGKKYIGTMQFVVENGKNVRPINTLLMEDYLKGVLPYEMSESWGNNGGLEALKAQAVAARTFASRYGSSIMTDTTSHQVYGGHTNLSNVNKAVEETKDVVAKYNGKLIETYFSASNGGKVLSNVNSWGGSVVPYLVMKEDPYELRSGNKYLNWSFSIGKQQIDLTNYDLSNPASWWNNVGETSTDLIKLNNAKSWLVANGFINGKYETKITGVPSIWFDTNIQEGKRIDGKVVLEYILKDKTNNNYVMENGKIKIHSILINRRAYDIRFMFGTSIMNSPQIKKVNDLGTSFEINGVGWGHGIGMSQYGAYQMSKEGKGYRDIINFYYPNVQLVDEIEPSIKNATVKLQQKAMNITYEINEDANVVVELVSAKSNTKTIIIKEQQKKGAKTLSYDISGLQGKYIVSVTATDKSSNSANESMGILIEEEIEIQPIEDFHMPIRLTERTTLYSEPSLQSNTFGYIGIQSVQARKKSGDFYLIDTYLGLKWIKPSNPVIGNIVLSGKTMILEDKTNLYSLPFNGFHTGGTLSPQSVYVVERWGTTSWYNIKTWEGNRWIRIDNPVYELPITGFVKKITLLERTSLFPASSISSGSYGTLSPQTVSTLRKQGESIEIETWQGPMWIHSKSFVEGVIVPVFEEINITERKDLYLEPNKGTFSGGTVSPQRLTVISKITNSKWIKINSYIGEVWLEI